MAWGTVAATANAQTAPQPAKPPAARKKAAPTKETPAAQAQPDLEPRAVEILKAVSSRLAGARTLTFTAVETYESSSRQGHPLAFANKSRVTLQRPDKLKVIVSGDGPASEFCYDGKVMKAFAPAEDLAAVADAPPTIDAALEAAYLSAGIYFPFTDLIVSDPYKDLAPGLQLAYYVGQSRIVGETTTDIVAFSGDGVFAQMFVGAEDKLPRLIHAVYLDDPERLRHNLVLSDWQLDPAIPADAFGSSSTASARSIPFAHPHPQPPPGAKARAKAQSPKTP